MGTVLLTGANGSLAIPAVSYVLSQYPTYTAVLTVRNTTAEGPNTAKLRAAIAQSPKPRCSIRRLDLTSLSAVQSLAGEIHHEIVQGKLPKLAAIICNAFS